MTSSIERSDDFFKVRQEKDTNRKEVFQQSQKLYKSEKICSVDSDCVEICQNLFSENRKDCLQLPAPQIYQLEKLYQRFNEKDQLSFKDIHVFDLLVFLNLSPEPLVSFFQTLGPFFMKEILFWLVSNWQIAEVFSEEDWDFLFLEIFLNQMQNSPIHSLKEEIAEGRTFMELAWIKQNDAVLFWLNDYFSAVLCRDIEKQEKENCILAQYCLLAESFQDDVSREIMDFEKLKQIVDTKGEYTGGLKPFCYSFCSDMDNQAYCKK